MKIIISLFLIFGSFLVAGQPLEEKVVASLDSFSVYNPQEKVYVQTDRSHFIAGESIWFKTYYTLFGKPGILSKIVYVTLSDETGTVLHKKLLKLTNASAAGAIDLPANTRPGNYFLSAYTLWMLNFPGFIIRKNITVYNNADANTKSNSKKIPRQVNVGFFPEGGKLIQGIKANVAFRAVDQWNRPAKTSGKILNNKNETLTSFYTSHDGMGEYSFMPAPGEAYYAIINEEQQQKKFDLPVVAEEGIVLTADNNNETKTFVKVERSQKNSAALNNLLLVAQHNYQVVYMAKINFDEGQDAVAINKKNLAPGIMQVTVFTPDGGVAASRAVFITGNTKEPELQANVNSGKRAKNNFSVDLSAFSVPDVAVSVVNAGADSSLRETNIRSSLLLSSDLVNPINQPAYYLLNKDSATLKHLDLLMLVQGWQRFNWEDVLSSKLNPIRYSYETGLSISGKVLKADGKSPLSSGKINLIIKGDDSTSILSEASVNAKSEFVVSDIEFKKLATVYYQGTNENNKNALVYIKMNEGYFDTLKRWAGFPPATTHGEANLYVSGYLKNMLAKKEQEDNTRNKLLQEVVLVSKKPSAIDSLNKLYVSPIFEYSDQTLVMDDGNYFDIWQFLQRMVPGIAIDKTEGTPRINFSRYDGLSFFSSDGPESGVQLFLNEVPVSPEIADNLNPADVSVVKVYKGITGITLGANRGAIGIYTKKGVSTRDWRVKGFDFIKKAGYSVSREFYPINYTILNPESSFTDLRPTLYWNPFVPVVNGKANIEFYNDDLSTKYKINLEGIDKDGKLISIEKILE